jgi:lipopolysaccharide/colanic/teichoic acid biosynthesis glycosyltransferase
MDVAESVEPFRRRGKEWRERIAVAVVFIPLSPLFALCAIAIKLEGLIDSDARGPVFFYEDRVSRGRVIKLMKFRTLRASGLASLGPGPTHIAVLEKAGHVTRVGGWIRQWYLDELPQLLNIIRGDMFLIGTRPWPIELYEAEMARGITRKRDMPAGLVGPVQASKGAPDSRGDRAIQVDLDYWAAFQTYPWWRLVALDLQILRRSFKVQMEHKGL